MGLTPQARIEYANNLRERYPYASKAQKKIMLDEFCTTCGYNRKYAIRLLNAVQRRTLQSRHSQRGRKRLYGDPLLVETLWQIWQAANQPCAKRLKALLPLWLPFFKHFIIPEPVQAQLLCISAATIDRIFARHRKKFKSHGHSTTKPGSLVKKRIPIQTNQWDQTVPGFLEADTVAHCGNSMQGQFVYTVNCVDIASGWTEQRAVWGRGESGVLSAIQHIEATLPFTLKGFDCDNGSEFLNWHLIRYLTERKQPVQFSRSRPYYKNDNAHVENKNWTHVRQLIGYERFEQVELVELLNGLYTSEWHDYFNFFIPSVKLISKERVGSKIVKTYDQPKTPVQRLLESPALSSTTQEILQQKLAQLNPFVLQKKLSTKIKNISKSINKNTSKI
jgi:hypothetical protein